MTRDTYDLYNIETSQGVFDIGGPIHDGGFVSISPTVSGTINLSAQVGIPATEIRGSDIVLTDVLPAGYEYLVYLTISAVSTSSASGTSIVVTIDGGYGNVNCCGSVSRSATIAQTGCGYWVNVNSNRRITVKNPYSQACTVTWTVSKYYRIGKNFDNPSTAITWNIFKDSNIYSENQRYNWTDIAYGNGKYVILGISGYISTSTDGINWIEPTLYTNLDIDANYWRSLTYGNGIFVALSSKGHISKSTDGMNWTVATQSSELGENSWSRIDYGDGKFVALGQNGTISTSTDGINWDTASIKSELGSHMWYALTYGNGKFVALSSYGGATDGAGKKLGGYYSTSTDGETWTTAVQLDQLTVAQWFGLVYGDNRFVAVSTQSLVITSSDGINWGHVNSNQSIKDVSEHGFWNGLVYANGKYVTVNTYGEIAISVIGCVQMIDIPNTELAWSDLESKSTLLIRDLAFGNDTFVALGSKQFIYSYDGVNWISGGTISTDATMNWTSIAYGDNKFVIVGVANSRLYFSYSEDGLNWSEIFPIYEGINFAHTNIYYTNGEFFITTYSEEILVLNSTTMVISRQFNIPTSEGSSRTRWQKVCYGDNKILLVEKEGYYTIMDADTYEFFTPIKSNFLDNVNDIKYVEINNEKMFIVVSEDGSISILKNNIWYPEIWTDDENSHSWNRISYDGNYIVVTGHSGRVLISKNGFDWYGPDRLNNYLSGADYFVTNGKDKFVIVSENSEVCYSYSLSIPNCNVALYRDCHYDNGILTCKSEDYAEIPKGRYNDALYQITFTNGDISDINKKTQTPLHSEYWISLDMNRLGLIIYNWELEQNEILIPISNLTSNITYQVQYEAHKTKAQARYRVRNNYSSLYGTTKIGSNDWLGVAYSNNLKKYVAVGSDGYFTTSIDGENWSTPSFISSSTKPDWNKIIFANGKFVALGSNYVTTSTNGTSWTALTQLSINPGTYGHCLNYCNGKYFIVGQTNSSTTTGCVISSTDGITWSSATNVGSVPWASIVYGGDKYVMVGVKTSGSDAGIYSAVSTNGTSWTISSKINITGTIRKVIYANDKFYACGQNAIINSTDGINWNVSNLNNVGLIEDMIYTTDMFFAHSNQGLITSIDGTNWSTDNRIMWNINQIIHVDGYYIFVADSGSIGKSSLCGWGNWSNWLSWNDNKRQLDASYPVRLGQGTHRDYFTMNQRGFKGSIDLTQSYIKPYVSTYYYWSGYNDGTNYEVYTSQSSGVQSASNIVFDMNLNELDDISFAYNNSKYYLKFSSMGVLICEMNRDSSKDITMPEYYWNGTDGTSTEILDLALNDTMNNTWNSKSVIVGSVDIDSEKDYIYSLLSYLPNDDNEYLVHTSASFGTTNVNNAIASLKIISMRNNINELGATVKAYSAAEHTKCHTFLVGPLKRADSLVYQLEGNPRARMYIRLSGYRKLGTMGKSLENKISKIETKENGYKITRQIGGWRLDGNWIPTVLEVARSLSLNSTNYQQWTDIDLSSILPYENLQYEVLMSIELRSGTTSPHELSIEFKSSVMGEAESSLTRTNASAYQYTRDQVILPIGRDRKLSWYSYTNNTSINGTVWMYINAYRRIGDIGGK